MRNFGGDGAMISSRHCTDDRRTVVPSSCLRALRARQKIPKLITEAAKLNEDDLKKVFAENFYRS